MQAHPLYDDEALVAEVTRAHAKAGRTVFQLWQVSDNEADHSVAMLDMVAPPHRARVLSLGCGIGGMEAYWQVVRPDLRFTLLNSSAAQLDQCVCPGRRVLGDAQDYQLLEGQEPFDVTILAYMLGHVDADKTLRRAMAATSGTVLVLDVDQGTPAFKRHLHYDPPSPALLRSMGFTKRSTPTARWYVQGLDWEDVPDYVHDAIEGSEPAIWVCRG